MSRTITLLSNMGHSRTSKIKKLLSSPLNYITNCNWWFTKAIHCIRDILRVTFKNYITDTHIPCKEHTLLQGL